VTPLPGSGQSDLCHLLASIREHAEGAVAPNGRREACPYYTADYGRRLRQKARELKERQTEITLRIEQHQKGETDYCTTLETLISVASRAAGHSVFQLFQRLRCASRLWPRGCCGILF
jgi:predicted component of type VI protein secretion system